MTDTPTPDPAEALAREILESAIIDLEYPEGSLVYRELARWILARYVPLGALRCGKGHDVSLIARWGTACPFCIVDERNSEITGLRQKIAILCGYDRPIAEQPEPEQRDFERTLLVVREEDEVDRKLDVLRQRADNTSELVRTHGNCLSMLGSQHADHGELLLRLVNSYDALDKRLSALEPQPLQDGERCERCGFKQRNGRCQCEEPKP